MAMVLLGILLAGCAADRVHRQGLAAIERGDYESGVGLLQQAAHDDPRNMTFRLDLQTQRNVAVQQLVARSDSERGAQQLEAAARDYRRVLALDPSNDRAQRGLLGLEADARHALTVSRARRDFERKDYDAADPRRQHGAHLSEHRGQAEGLRAIDRAHLLSYQRGTEGRREHVEDRAWREDALHRRAHELARDT